MTQAALQQQIAAAVQHHQAGRFAQAEAGYRALLAQFPKHPEILQLLGAVASQTGRLDEAISLTTRAISLYPNNPVYHSNLAEMYRRAGKTSEAIASARRAIQLKPDFSRAFGNLGAALRDAGQLDDAIAAFRRAIAISPDFLEAISNLANTLKAKEQFADAVVAFRRLCELQPQSAEAWCNLGIALRENKQFDEAIAAFNRSITAKPDFAPAYNNMGVAYSESDRIEQATELFRRAVEIQPNYAHAYKNLGVAFGEQMRYADSLAAFQKSIDSDPDMPESRSNRAIILLTLGQYEQAWQDYEWRWRANLKNLAPPRQLSQPRWDGTPLDGKTILLHAEQGFGDTIQFARYAPLVAQRGGRVIVECQAELARLFRTLPGVTQVIARGDPLPRFDVHSPLLSLPLSFGTTLESVPANIPYLFPDPALAAKWKAKLAPNAAKLKVGIAWSGSPKNKLNRFRALTTTQFTPLAELKNVAFYSLQKGDPARQPPPPGVEWIDYTPDLHDFAETAALAANLDLVVTVDTALAHVVGAIGKPLWILVSYYPAWQWMLEREDSPWYPTARLFREKLQNDWPRVVQAVKQELQSLL